MKNITDLLSETPERIFEEYARLTSKEATSKKCDDKYWNQTYVYWKSISKTWLSNLICEIGGQYGLTQSVLDSIDEHDTNAIRQLCCHIFGVRAEEKFPRACLDKACMRHHLLNNANLLGNRYRTFIQRGGLAPDNSLNWVKAAAYVFEWREGKAVAMTHDKICGEKHTIDLTTVAISIDTRWELVEPFDDRNARVRQSWLEPTLKDFFKESWAASFWTVFDDKAAAARAQSFKDGLDAPMQQVTNLDAETLVKGPAKRSAEAKAKAKQRTNPRAPLKVKFEIEGAAAS